MYALPSRAGSCACSSRASCSRAAVKIHLGRNGHALAGFAFGRPRHRSSLASVSRFGIAHTTGVETIDVNLKERLKVNYLRWNQATGALSVSRLWTQIFCDYYYGEALGEDKEFGRRLSEFIYFFTMLFSCVSAVLGKNSFCLVANDESESPGLPVGAIAGRLISDHNSDTVFLPEDWQRLCFEEFNRTKKERKENDDDFSLLYLWNFGVDKKHRKKGAATKVMEWLERESEGEALDQEEDSFASSSSSAMPRGVCLFVYRTNRPAIKLYEKLGYKIVESWQDPKWLAQAEKHSSTGVQRKLLMIKHL